MRYKYALLTILISMLLVAPVFAFEHPTPPPDGLRPPCPYFGVTVNKTWAVDPAHAYVFEEPGLYCTDFTVEVNFMNVSDLYGYEFVLNWDPVYFGLKSGPVIEKLWDTATQIYVNASVTASSWKVVATGSESASGLPLGDYLLATFTFHIINDVCYLQGTVHTGFWLTGMKASDSCSQPIKPCTEFNAYVDLEPVKPKIKIVPKSENNSQVGDKFTMTVEVENIVKMTDIDLWVSWWGYHVLPEDFYTALLCTKEADIEINEAVFPKANRTVADILVVNSPNCSKRHYPPDYAGGWVHLKIAMDPDYPLINGSFWVMKITFEKCDPWYCGAQPLYHRQGDHDWLLDWAETDIVLEGEFSVYCFDYHTMPFPGGSVDVENAHYIFKPIPGDLNGSGHVDITDLMIEAFYYGKGTSESPWTWAGYYYDLDKNGYIDVFDLVIVAKNICRSVP